MVKVEVKEDFVMQRVIREQGALLVDQVDDQATLETAWHVLNGGTLPLPTPEKLKSALRHAFDTAQPYQLAYEGWKTLQEYLEPPRPPSPELQALAERIDAFFGIRPGSKRRIEG